MRKILRYEVPVDGKWHERELTGPILKVAGRNQWVVEFWALAGEWMVTDHHRLRVYGSGAELPEDCYPIGTVVHDELVWHLVEQVPASSGGEDDER